MILQQMLFIGCYAWILCKYPHFPEELVPPASSSWPLHWYFMGALMTGESPDAVAPRETQAAPERSGPGLPHVVQSWPGDRLRLRAGRDGRRGGIHRGRAVLRAAARGENALRAEVFRVRSMVFWWQSVTGGAVTISIVLLSYLAFYLGVGLMLLRLLRRVTAVTIATAPLVHLLLAMIAFSSPWWSSSWVPAAAIHVAADHQRALDYCACVQRDVSSGSDGPGCPCWLCLRRLA